MVNVQALSHELAALGATVTRLDAGNTSCLLPAVGRVERGHAARNTISRASIAAFNWCR